MDPNGNNNRLHLNFGYNERAFNPAAMNNRAYPTTPSAFPQPIYQNQGPQDYMDTQNGAYGGQGQGYFMTNPYPPQTPQYAQAPYGQQMASPQQPTYQNRVPFNDGTNGLIQQFSNQDLNSPRGGFFNRNASPGQRPRTAGSSAPGQQQQQPHLVPPMPRSPRTPAENEELQRNPERISENVHKRGKAAKELVNVFFHENIERARDRNMR